ncbi:tyrosinase [Crassisporium funariophilum]|nr:tyrosinase [Crassisporium funariophilum]
MSRVVITGAGGGSPNRLEINEFIKNEKYFSLYVQALQAMQTKTPQSDFQSFFQVSGIHGLPYIAWDGATGGRAFDPSTTWGGYCTHGSVLFPTWHRPYVMLYEQILQKHAEEIAVTYTVDKEAWKQAALELRQPYWDWASNSVPPDQVIALKRVEITGPNGTKVTVDNPLYHYRFHPIDASFPRPYRDWPTTLRQPTTINVDAIDNVSRLKSVLRAAQPDIRDSTYSMLTRVRTWTAFSNHTAGDGGSTSNSLEAIHDGIHVSVGGRGQMSDPAVAAFDPIFFLHHCNVDRLLSLWAALNPGTWVSRGDSEDGSFTMPPEIPVDQTTPLTPFWNAQTTFWASTGTGDTSKLGYTYPEFKGLDMGNSAAVKTAIGKIVNQLYGSSAAFSAASVAPTGVTEGEAKQKITSFASTASHQQVLLADISRSVQSPAEPQHDHHIPEKQPTELLSQDLWDWTARIEFQKYELGCSFSVLLFLGQVPEDPEDWLVSPNFIGAHHAFVNSTAGQCANCRNQGNLVGEGFVHLDNGISLHSGLTSLDPSVVEPYLTEALHWRVQKADGSPAELESLEVAVFATPLSYPPGSMFPVPGQARRHNRITHGRSGGSRHA